MFPNAKIEPWLLKLSIASSGESFDRMKKLKKFVKGDAGKTILKISKTFLNVL